MKIKWNFNNRPNTADSAGQEADPISRQRGRSNEDKRATFREEIITDHKFHTGLDMLSRVYS
jgi:hypothetical protein